MPGSDIIGVNRGDLVDQGASAALPQSAGTGSPAAPNMQAALQLINALNRGGALSGRATGQLTTAQSQIPTPHLPTYTPGQAPQVAQGGFASTGARKRADKQAMMNNLANLVNMGTKALHDKKVREVQDIATKAQGAMVGLKQAATILKQDPNNQEAKEQYETNKQILDDIRSDPKKVKDLEKAFSVKLIGDDKGRATPQYQGVMKAVASAGEQMAQKFERQVPSVQQISPQTQVQAALIQMGIQPKAGEQLAAQTEMLKEVVSLSKTMDTNATREKLGQMLVDQKDRGLANDLIKVSQQVLGKQITAQILATAQVKRANIMANAAMQDTQWRMVGQILNTQAKASNNTKQMGALSTEYQRIQNELKNVQQDVEKGDWTIFQTKAGKEASQKIQDLRQQQARLLKRMDDLNMIKDADAGDTNNTGSGSNTGTAGRGKDKESTEFDRFFEGLINEFDSPDQ